MPQQRDYKVVIAGKKYALRYRLAQRDDIEQESSARGTHRNLIDVILSGQIRDQAIAVWAGIRGADPDARVTPRGLIEAFQRHNDKGGDYYQQIVCPAYIAMGESGLFGQDHDIEELKRVIRYKDPEGKAEDEDAVAAGGPPAAARAGE